ncbi:hypothetical protein AVEN_258030-1, partial [Araneus ventricosus]
SEAEVSVPRHAPSASAAPALGHVGEPEAPLSPLRPAPEARRRGLHLILHIPHLPASPRESRPFHTFRLDARPGSTVHVRPHPDPFRPQRPPPATDHDRPRTPVRRERGVPVRKHDKSRLFDDKQQEEETARIPQGSQDAPEWKWCAGQD